MSAAFQASAFQNSAFQTDGITPPVVPADTHDGAGWVQPSKYKKPTDPFDRTGLLDTIKRAAGLIAEEEPENAAAVAATEAAIRAEVQQPQIDPLLLAMEVEQLMRLSAGMEQIYAQLYEIAQNLYAEQDEEDAIMALLM